MDVLLHTGVAWVGLLAGLLILSRTFLWLHVLWAANKDRQKDGGSKASLIMLSVLHSGPWGLVAAIVLASHIFSGPHHVAWNWFFGGMLATPLVMGVNVALFLRRRKRRMRPAAQA